MTKALDTTGLGASGKRPASSMETPTNPIQVVPAPKKLKAEDQTLTIQLSGSALSSGSASSITISGIGGSGGYRYSNFGRGPYDSLRNRMRWNNDKRDSST